MGWEETVNQGDSPPHSLTLAMYEFSTSSSVVQYYEQSYTVECVVLQSTVPGTIQYHHGWYYTISWVVHTVPWVVLYNIMGGPYSIMGGPYSIMGGLIQYYGWSHTVSCVV